MPPLFQKQVSKRRITHMDLPASAEITVVQIGCQSVKHDG